MLELVAALYKEHVDFLIYTRRDGSKAQEVDLAEKGAIARTLAMFYNLPANIKAAKDQIERQKAYEDKMKAHEAQIDAKYSRSGEQLQKDASLGSYANKLAYMQMRKEAEDAV